MAVPTLYLFDRWDERIGTLPTLGAMTHSEELGGEDTITSVTFAEDMAGVEGLSMDYWFYNVKSRAMAWSGWGNVRPVTWEFFLNGSLNITELDLRGLDAFTIKRWGYALAGMSSLTTIYVDAGWTLPASFASRSNAFYGDRLLVGGNGTAYDASKTGADMAVVDSADAPGYLTVR